MAEDTAADRLAQLREGIEGAAASLPVGHSDLAAASVEAASRAATAAETLGGALAGGGGTGAAGGGARRPAPGIDAGRVRGALREAVDTLEGLHFALLRMKVRGMEPEEAGARAGAEEALRRAEALEGMLAARPAGAQGETSPG